MRNSLPWEEASRLAPRRHGERREVQSGRPRTIRKSRGCTGRAVKLISAAPVVLLGRLNSRPGHGCETRYHHGLFTNGWQRECVDTRPSSGNSWEFERLQVCFPAHFGCGVDAPDDLEPTGRCKWKPAQPVDAVAYDTPVVGLAQGAREHAASLVRTGARSRRLDPFNRGDHRSIGARARAESISEVLYPSDGS